MSLYMSIYFSLLVRVFKYFSKNLILTQNHPTNAPPEGACPLAAWQAARGRAPLTTSPKRGVVARHQGLSRHKTRAKSTRGFIPRPLTLLHLT